MALDSTFSVSGVFCEHSRLSMALKPTQGSFQILHCTYAVPCPHVFHVRDTKSRLSRTLSFDFGDFFKRPLQWFRKKNAELRSQQIEIGCSEVRSWHIANVKVTQRILDDLDFL